MIRMDVHDKMLQAAAADMALKMGHMLREWVASPIVYSSGRKKVKKVVASYVGQCRHCNGEVRIASGLEEQMQGAILEDACELNTGMREIILPLHHDNSGCGGVLAYSLDMPGHNYLRECA